MLRKLFLFSGIGLIFIFIFNSCGKKPEVTEVPKTEELTVALTSSDREIKGELLSFGLSDLEIIKTVDKSTKELTTTPSLKGTLTKPQAALLAAVLPNPHRWSPKYPTRYIRERQSTILREMKKLEPSLKPHQSDK